MIIYHKAFVFDTSARATFDITSQIHYVVSEAKVKDGLCQIFLSHTSASLIFCENADATVRRDLEAFMQRLVPDGNKLFLHTAEGPDDMPAHIRTILTQNSLTVPIVDGCLALGTWQGIYLWEHRFAPHRRKVTVTVLGNT